MSRCGKYEWKRSGFSETGNTKLSVINAPSSFVVVDVMTVIRAVLKCTRRDAATTPGIRATSLAMLYNCCSFITTVPIPSLPKIMIHVLCSSFLGNCKSLHLKPEKGMQPAWPALGEASPRRVRRRRGMAQSTQTQQVWSPMYTWLAMQASENRIRSSSFANA